VPCDLYINLDTTVLLDNDRMITDILFALLAHVHCCCVVDACLFIAASGRCMYVCTFSVDLVYV